MNSKKGVTLYNLIFPVWILLWFPSWLWLIIIPANYIIDRLIFTILGKHYKPELTKDFYRNNTWKLFLRGFGADFIGMLFLLVPTIILGNIFDSGSVVGKFTHELQYNPYNNPVAVIYTLIAVALAGLMIYLFDRRALRKMGVFTEEQVKKITLYMAIFTAPYLYLLPPSLFY